MQDQKGAQQGNEEERGEQEGSQGKRSYATYSRKEKLSFDPLKDLNLPGSYEEVLARFKRLQLDRAMEALN